MSSTEVGEIEEKKSKALYYLIGERTPIIGVSPDAIPLFRSDEKLREIYGITSASSGAPGGGAQAAMDVPIPNVEIFYISQYRILMFGKYGGKGGHSLVASAQQHFRKKKYGLILHSFWHKVDCDIPYYKIKVFGNSEELNLGIKTTKLEYKYKQGLLRSKNRIEGFLGLYMKNPYISTLWWLRFPKKSERRNDIYQDLRDTIESAPAIPLSEIGRYYVENSGGRILKKARPLLEEML